MLETNVLWETFLEILLILLFILGRSRFNGCMRSLLVNGDAVPIVSLETSLENADCCPSIQEGITRSSVMSLNGFGFAVIDTVQSRSINTDFTFRSYSPDGDIIRFIGENDTIAVLSLERGKIKLQTHLDETVSTHNYYNYGKQVAVSCVTKNSSVICGISSDRFNDSLNAAVGDFTMNKAMIGSTVNETDRFAGCITNLTISGRAIDAWRDVKEFSGLQPYCYDEVSECKSVLIS